MTEQTGWCRLRDGTIADVNAVTAIVINLAAIVKGTSPVLGPVEGRKITGLLCAVELADIAKDASYQPALGLRSILVTCRLIQLRGDGTCLMHDTVRSVVLSMFQATGVAGVRVQNPIAETNVPAPK